MVFDELFFFFFRINNQVFVIVLRKKFYRLAREKIFRNVGVYRIGAQFGKCTFYCRIKRTSGRTFGNGPSYN